MNVVYPVFIDIRAKRCLVIGGGKVAERKVRGLLREKADVVIVSPAVTEGIALLAARAQCCWLKKKYSADDLHGAFLVFAVTDSPTVQERVVSDAEALGLPVNVADQPERCTFHVPAVLRRGDLTIAVSTTGKSPALAAMVRQMLAEQYGEEYAQLLSLMGKLRPLVINGARTSDERKTMFQKILHGDMIHWIKSGRWDKVRHHLQTVLGPEVHHIMNRDERHG
ncbi:MAG: hypothetical protein DSY57_05150 [Desulfobulbus sp.]|nr:MAG: hypothetical protein DSY57_05150 [Desulfobulbus sp.]